MAVRIASNHLVNELGQPIRLFGINRIAGVPCTRVHSPYIFDGPSDKTSVIELTKWHINTVRITMNEDCWLGINNAPAQTSGTNYRNAISTYVHLLNAYGIYAIIDLHINAPGKYLATNQQAMADKDHALAYWTSVADTFKNDPAVIFEPYNEPHITTKNAHTNNAWKCWLNGCIITQIDVGKTKPLYSQWQAVGMQQLVNAIRSTGATNVITLGGLSFSNNLKQFLHYIPKDSLHQLAATFHNYQPSAKSNYGCGPSCWNSVILPISQQMPVITDEFGGINCQSGFVIEYMTWADQHGISYLPWGWDPWGCTASENPTGHAYGMLSNWNGTPNSYGLLFYNHFRQINTTPSLSPIPSPNPTLNKSKTTFILTLCPHGLGNCGDSITPSGRNISPKHPVRNITLVLTNATNTPVVTISGLVTYNASSQNFQGNLSTTNLSTGNYLITVKMDGYLGKLLPGIFTIKNGQTVLLPEVWLTAGDINNDNTINILDYSILISCFEDSMLNHLSTCSAPVTTQSPGADLDDDGIVDGTDYNLFIRELSTQKGAGSGQQLPATTPSSFSSTSSNCQPNPILVNPCRPWLGAAVFGYPQAPIDYISQFNFLEQQLGRPLDIFHDYHAPGSLPLNNSEIHFATQPNTYIYVNWKPAVNWAQADGANASVNANIDKAAASIKSIAPHKIFLTIWHEPEKYVSQGTSNCPGLKGNAGSPTQYKAMWQNVENRFKSDGVTNVVWVMNYMGYSAWDCLVPQLWPGNNLVNWVTFDAYPDNNTDTWQSTVGEFYNLLQKDTTSTTDFAAKPWGAAEFGTCFLTNEQQVYQYLQSVKQSIDENLYPNIKMYMLFASTLGPKANMGCLTNYTTSGQYDQTKLNMFKQIFNDPLLLR